MPAAEKRTRRTDDARRARLYVAELAWLDGYDDGAAWRRFDTDDEVALEGARIAKARRDARTVLREHPRSLRALVGDVDRWWQIVDAKLAWCSAQASGKQPAAFDPAPYLPPRTARKLAQLRAGRAGDVARVVATAWIRDVDRVAEALDWIDAHEPALAGVAGQPHARAVGPLRVACALARLALDGSAGKPALARGAGVAAVLELLAIDAPDCDAALDVTRSAESRLLRHRAKPAADPKRSGARTVAWVLALARRDHDARQRALELIAVTPLAAAIAPWHAWEREQLGVIARANELAGRDFASKDRAIHVGRLAGKLAAARERAPAAISLADAILEIDMLATARFVRFHGAIVRLLAATREPPDARVRLLLHLARAAATSDDDEHLEWLWDALGAALAGDARVAILEPWRPVMAGDIQYAHVDNALVARARRRSDVERIVRSCVEYARRHSRLTATEARNIATWAAAGLPDDVALEVAHALRDASTEHASPRRHFLGTAIFDDETARAIVALCDGSASDVVALGRAMLDVAKDLEWHARRQLAAFVEHAARTGLGWLVRSALAAKQRERLGDAAQLVMSIPAARRPRLVAPPDPTWIARYPAALAAALHRLATVDPDAERTAARRLADSFPDPADLRREIEALRERATSWQTSQRLANLERRLASPTPPSAKRLANLADRIDATARELGFTRLIAEATRIGAERLVSALGLEGWPAWAEAGEPKRREILFGLLDLEPADRALARRLLQARSGPRPWDLRDESANRRFLDQMRAAGVDPAPWLDATARTVRTRDGEHLALALCDDPLDVFEMGAHFDTCLAPRGGNFFSVVANAADINKRVLYARRGGRIVGRCLFALTDAFALLTFRPYCHEQIEFDAHVRDFALDLAARMNTTLAASGPVRTLLARDWYDDGSRDLVGRFAALDDTLDIASIPPDELVARLRAALGRDLDDITLPLVLGHRALRGSARHLAPLVPFIVASSISQTRVDAAALALDAGDVELADRLLGEHGHAVRLEAHVWPRGIVVARLRPSETLARLRRTRYRTVRRWSDERADRVALAGIALEALQRPRQAAAMYRLAAKLEDWIAPFMRERLQALDQPIDGDTAR